MSVPVLLPTQYLHEYSVGVSSSMYKWDDDSLSVLSPEEEV